MKCSSVFLALAVVVACVAGVHGEAYYYRVDRSGSNDVGTGDVTVRGAVKVDALGAVSAGGFSSWVLTFDSDNYVHTTLTPGNGTLDLNAAGVATATELIMTFPEETGPGTVMHFQDAKSSSAYDVGWRVRGGGQDPVIEYIRHTPRYSTSSPLDQAMDTLASGPYLVAMPRLDVRTYRVDRSVPHISGSGTVSVAGTVTVGGDGSAGAGDIVDWQLEFSSANYGATTLTPLNSELICDVPVAATDTELTFTFPGSSQNVPLVDLTFRDTVSGPFSVNWDITAGDMTNPREAIGHSPRTELTDPSDYGQFWYTDAPDTYVLSLPIVPEPGTLSIVLVGLLAGRVLARRRVTV